MVEKGKEWNQEWGSLLTSVLNEQNIMMLAKDTAFVRTLHDTVEDLEGIKSRFDEFLEATRKEAPRLYGLSEEEVTKLLVLKPELLNNSHLIHKLFAGV